MNNIYGYIRVSSIDQNEDRQIIEMKKLNINDEHIYIDKISGKNFDRPQYKELIKHIKENDILYVKSIDRLGRNYNEILNQWRMLTKIKKIDIVVIDMPILDTRVGKDLLGTFISDLVLQILSFVAENERVNIKQRQLEGIKAAKTRGTVFGRPPKDLPDNFSLIYHKWKNKEITGIEASKLCQMPVSTFYYKAKNYKGII